MLPMSARSRLRHFEGMLSTREISVEATSKVTRESKRLPAMEPLSGHADALKVSNHLRCKAEGFPPTDVSLMSRYFKYFMWLRLLMSPEAFDFERSTFLRRLAS